LKKSTVAIPVPDVGVSYVIKLFPAISFHSVKTFSRWRVKF